jgi:hypothetical protein
VEEEKVGKSFDAIDIIFVVLILCYFVSLFLIIVVIITSKAFKPKKKPTVEKIPQPILEDKKEKLIIPPKPKEKSDFIKLIEYLEKPSITITETKKRKVLDKNAEEIIFKKEDHVKEIPYKKTKKKVNVKNYAKKKKGKTNKKKKKK